MRMRKTGLPYSLGIIPAVQRYTRGTWPRSAINLLWLVDGIFADLPSRPPWHYRVESNADHPPETGWKTLPGACPPKGSSKGGPNKCEQRFRPVSILAALPNTDTSRFWYFSEYGNLIQILPTRKSIRIPYSEKYPNWSIRVFPSASILFPMCNAIHTFGLARPKSGVPVAISSPSDNYLWSRLATEEVLRRPSPTSPNPSRCVWWWDRALLAASRGVETHRPIELLLYYM